MAYHSNQSKTLFFTVPLPVCDTDRFAFLILAFNRGCPIKGYHWKLMQPFCQYLVLLVEMIHKLFPQSIIYHYMNGTLLDGPDINNLERIFDEVQNPCLAGVCKLPMKMYKEGILLIF